MNEVVVSSSGVKNVFRWLLLVVRLFALTNSEQGITSNLSASQAGALS